MPLTEFEQKARGDSRRHAGTCPMQLPNDLPAQTSPKFPKACRIMHDSWEPWVMAAGCSHQETPDLNIAAGSLGGLLLGWTSRLR